MTTPTARVLVIDDDEVVLVAICDLLEGDGHKVFTQISPIGATQAIIKNEIDVVVVDLNLPEMRGDSVVRLIRSWDRLKDLPVIMISGAATDSLEQMRKSFPAIQVLSKSVLETDLSQAISRSVSTNLLHKPPKWR